MIDRCQSFLYEEREETRGAGGVLVCQLVLHCVNVKGWTLSSPLQTKTKKRKNGKTNKKLNKKTGTTMAVASTTFFLVLFYFIFVLYFLVSNVPLTLPFSRCRFGAGHKLQRDETGYLQRSCV